MIISPEDLLVDLDAELQRAGLHYELIVCGGFVMRQRYYPSPEDRKTADLDSLSELDDRIRLAAMTVGQRLLKTIAGADDQFYWLNDRVRESLHLHQKLPLGWEGRSLSEDPVFRGENLVVYPLPRQEMALTKLHVVLEEFTTGRPRRAQFRLEQDLKDLRALGYNTETIGSLVAGLRRMIPWPKRWFIKNSKLLEKLRKLVE